MPRRRALRLLGGAVAMAAFPGFRVRTARGGSVPKKCPRGTELCMRNELQVCMPKGGTCCWFTPEDSGYEPWGLVVGCGPGASCGSAQDGAIRCIYPCPNGRASCGQGSKCCPPGEKCLDQKRGICGECPPARNPCGPHCCGKNGTCCDPERGLCCKPNQHCGSYGDYRICCRYKSCGSKNQKPRCCRSPEEACVPLLGYENGGWTDTSPRVCCPRRRQVFDKEGGSPNACCPPGYVTLSGGRMSVGAGNGVCCNEQQICGNGSRITCCPTTRVCCNGDCCPSGLICCEGACIDPNDNLNCGKCGAICNPPRLCVDGSCILL
jgi:hypothetical protein